LSSDGNAAVIGASRDSGNVGAVFVFTRSGTTWSQQQKLTASDATAAASFGISVALSSDGNTTLIGGPGDTSGAGAAWVFTRSAGIWSQQGLKLTGSGESGAGEFGVGISMSADGNTALIGGLTDNGNVGAEWAFTKSGSSWTQQGPKLTASDEVGGGFFGSGSALSADGNTAVITGPHDNGLAGAGWVFARSGTTWTQQGSKLTANDEMGAGQFGIGIALTPDGSTALIGGSDDNSGAGAAWAFSSSAPLVTGLSGGVRRQSHGAGPASQQSRPPRDPRGDAGPAADDQCPRPHDRGHRPGRRGR
jgi:hypothetical protein